MTPQALAEQVKIIADDIAGDDTYHESYAETLRQAARLLAGLGWQPIETAPRDGTKFIGHGKRKGDMGVGPYETRWEAYGEGSMAHDAFLVGQGPEGGFWFEESNWIQTWNPTHWMPLPSPPLFAPQEGA